MIAKGNDEQTIQLNDQMRLTTWAFSMESRRGGQEALHKLFLNPCLVSARTISLLQRLTPQLHVWICVHTYSCHA